MPSEAEMKRLWDSQRRQESLGDIPPVRSMRELWLEYGNLTDEDGNPPWQREQPPLASQTNFEVPNTTSQMRLFLDSVKELLCDISRDWGIANTEEGDRVDGSIGVLEQLFAKDHFLYGQICEAHLNGIVNCKNGCG